MFKHLSLRGDISHSTHSVQFISECVCRLIRDVSKMDVANPVLTGNGEMEDAEDTLGRD